MGSSVQQRPLARGHSIVVGALASAVLCGVVLVGTISVVHPAGASSTPRAPAHTAQVAPHETSFHVDPARLAALRAMYGGAVTSDAGPVAMSPSSSPSAVHASSSTPPLTLANFEILDPNGDVQTISGPVTLPFGGIHTWQFLAMGYGFQFDDNARTLTPGKYSLSVDGQASLTNELYCADAPLNRGQFEIDQAVYDSAFNATSTAIQFDFVCADGTVVTGTIAYQVANTTPNQGYYIYDPFGDVTGFGNDSYLVYLGMPAALDLTAPIVDMVPTSDGNGYWMLSSDGGVYAYGDATFYGSMGGKPLNERVVGMASTTDGRGYWLVAADGGIFAFGDATFFGSRGGQPLNKPIVGMAGDPGGRGYWLVASDGGIFSYGGAPFLGSTGAIHLNQPVVGMTPTADGKGYWFVASDGGIFAYGDAQFYGSAASLPLAEPVVGMLGTPGGGGYWLVALDGGVFNYGDAPFAGSLGGGENIQAGLAL